LIAFISLNFIAAQNTKIESGHRLI